MERFHSTFRGPCSTEQLPKKGAGRPIPSTLTFGRAKLPERKSLCRNGGQRFGPPSSLDAESWQVESSPIFRVHTFGTFSFLRNWHISLVGLFFCFFPLPAMFNCWICSFHANMAANKWKMGNGSRLSLLPMPRRRQKAFVPFILSQTLKKQVIKPIKCV
jgi:hypothetical protein